MGICRCSIPTSGMRRVVRHLLMLFALALGQAGLTVALTVFVFGSGMSRFGTGDPAPAGVQIASVLVGALAYGPARHGRAVVSILGVLKRLACTENDPQEEEYHASRSQDHALFMV